LKNRSSRYAAATARENSQKSQNPPKLQFFELENVMLVARRAEQFWEFPAIIFCCRTPSKLKGVEQPKKSPNKTQKYSLRRATIVTFSKIRG